MIGELVKERILQKIFNDAPDGATHYCIDDSSYFSFDDESGMWSKWGSNRWYAYFGPISSRLISRPPKQIKDLGDVTDTNVGEWSGEGFPPVGTVCEAVWLELPDGGGRDWTRCLLMGVYDDLVWINVHEYDSDGLYSGYPLTLRKDQIEFRPLKTDAEKEKERVVDMAWGRLKFVIGSNVERDKEIIGQLYDNGMLIDPDK